MLRLLRYLIPALFKKFILRQSNGTVVKYLASNMGMAYIKLAQILAMQNIGNLFTESDRVDLLHICDDVNPIKYSKIEKTLEEAYGSRLHSIFKIIYEEPLGSASVSQVHKAVLYNGDTVVLKVRRKNLIDEITRDMNLILFIVKHFGKLIGFYNYMGSSKALDFYEKWLKEEIDFNHEVENINTYHAFINKVNGKLDGCVDIVAPNVYEELCNEDVIVMEYISHPTVSNSCDRDSLLRGLDSYIKLSFYALFNGINVVWHGDPHAGNLYIDNNGNIGFLDMGLVFSLSDEDMEMTRDFFFGAYFGDHNKLYDMLVPYVTGNSTELDAFHKDIIQYCNTLHSRPITSFFMDMVLVCFKYNISPPDYLYGMAKAFVCLGGIDTVYFNKQTGHALLAEQVVEFLIRNAIDSSKQLVVDYMKLTESLLDDDIVSVSRNIINCYNSFTDIFRYFKKGK